MRMRQRSITRSQVIAALRNYHTSYPARALANVPVQGVLYIGNVDGRDLLVWVEPESNPVYVRSTAWRNDDDRI